MTECKEPSGFTAMVRVATDSRQVGSERLTDPPTRSKTEGPAARKHGVSLNWLLDGSIYCGSIALPFVAFLLAPSVRRKWRLLLAGVVGQVAASAVVFWLVRQWWQAGYEHWYFGNLYYIPVNGFAALYYLCVILLAVGSRSRESTRRRSPDSGGERSVPGS